MAQNFPAPKGVPERAAPYSRFILAAAVPQVLTGLVDQAQCASTGVLVFATAAASAFTYTDCTGASVTVSALAAGVYDFGNIAMLSITASTTCNFLVYWHGSGARV